MYVSCGNAVKCFDLHNMVSSFIVNSFPLYVDDEFWRLIYCFFFFYLKASPWTPFKSYTYNKEEINQVNCYCKVNYLVI